MGNDWKQYIVTAENDDWTQIEDAVARKRAQNRLAQRAHRRKHGRRSRKLTKEQEQEHLRGDVTLASVEAASSHAQPLLQPATTLVKPDAFSPLIESHLMTSTGALAAILMNSTILGIDCKRVPRLVTIHVPSSRLTPPALRPTTLQLQQVHLPYIDLLPFSSLRDNLLRAGDLVSGAEFWVDLSNHVRVWGSTPWDKRGWEVREHFVRRWWWVLSEEVLDEANYWRVSRGEDHLDLEAMSAGLVGKGVIA